MNNLNAPRPKLAELGMDLLQVSSFRKALTLCYPFLWCGAYFAFAWAGYWPLAIVALVCLSFATYGSTSHDLVHRNLRLSRKTNDILLTIIELLAIRSGHAYQAAHLRHHAIFPSHDDIEGTAARRSFFGAIAEGFTLQFRIWFWAVREARHYRTWIICEGIACVVVAALSAATFMFSPIFLIYVLVMIMGSWIIPLMTSYLPHTPEAETELFQTRVFRGVAASILAVEHLYHLEHHLYPAVPHANWPKLAKRLDPYLLSSGVKPVVFWF